MKQFALVLLSLLFLSANNLFCDSLTPLQKKKQDFLKEVLPAVNSVYNELEKQYIDILEHYHDPIYKKDLQRLKKVYKVKTIKELLSALKPHPISITIAQAAMESAWGKSRFYKEANNIFGVWSLNSYDQRIAANESRADKIIWLKKYNIIDDSIRDYYITLGRHRAYREFRNLKMQTNDSYELIKKLNRYSERGQEYCDELKIIIEYNNFTIYDKD